MVASGHGGAHIANSLTISERTVRFHLRGIYDILGGYQLMAHSLTVGERGLDICPIWKMQPIELMLHGTSNWYLMAGRIGDEVCLVKSRRTVRGITQGSTRLVC
jgi:hypothetical protein